MATFYARKANKLLRIGEDSIEKYIAQGYTITDMQGGLVQKGIPHDVNGLTAECKKQDVEIASLKEENESLKTENAKLAKEVGTLKAELDKLKSTTPISDAPKTTRKRKQATEEE